MNGTERLASAIEKRMDELGMSVVGWARKSGVSDATLRKMKMGRQNSFPATKERPAELALGWAPGSFDSIRSGKQPTLVDSVRPRGNPAASSRLTDGLKPEQVAILEAMADQLRRANQ